MLDPAPKRAKGAPGVDSIQNQSDLIGRQDEIDASEGSRSKEKPL